jgi:hypothetical protein
LRWARIKAVIDGAVLVLSTKPLKIGGRIKIKIELTQLKKVSVG